MFEMEEDEKISDFIKSLGGIGIFLAAALAVIFLGSVAAML